MDFRSPAHLQSITQGRWLVAPTDDAAPVTGFSFDTRTLKPGDLFLAIRSETSDGHQYVQTAIDKGAAMVMVEDTKFEIRNPKHDTSKPEPELSRISAEPTASTTPDSPFGFSASNFGFSSIPLLLVPDTVAALQKIAAAWRTILGEHGVKVVAVTGSNGKTTTRNMIHCALSAKLRGTQSPKSFNNHLGVPLTLLAASIEDDFVVAEVGTNHPGEIAALAAILKPHIAVITNIGTAHIGMFGSKDAIAAEKSSLFRFLEPDGRAVMRCSEAYAGQWRREVVPRHARIITFGRHENAFVRITGPVTTDSQGLHFTLISGAKVDLPLLGEHNIENALAAVAVARAMGIEDVDAAAALSHLTGVEMRMQIIRLGRHAARADASPRPALTVIADCYNANPDSMAAGLKALATLPVTHPVRRVAIVGDMRELGDETIGAHQDVGRLIRDLGGIARDNKPENGDVADISPDQPKNIDVALLIGEQMRHAADVLALGGGADRITHHAQWSDALPGQVAGLLREGDLVYLKASRGMQLERLIPAMEQRFGPRW